MNKNALLGYTGFIGANLNEMFEFNDLYNSKNIKHIRNKKYDLIFSAANSGIKWKVNQDPEADFDNIKKFIEIIDSVSAKKFVLISSIDIYPNPYNVDEDTIVHENSKIPYGNNRLYLEKFVRKRFENHLIIRIPIIYGKYFRKNFIYDLLNNHEIEKINTKAKVQIYNVKNLKKHIKICLNNNIKIINLATEPIRIIEIANKIFGRDLSKNKDDKEFIYDMRSKYFQLFNGVNGYIQSKKEILNELMEFKDNYKNIL